MRETELVKAELCVKVNFDFYLLSFRLYFQRKSLLRVAKSAQKMAKKVKRVYIIQHNLLNRVTWRWLGYGHHGV